MAETYGVIDWFAILKKKAGLLIVGLIGGVLLSFILTKWVLVPKYSTITQLLVSRPVQEGQVLNLNDIQTNIQLINTYKGIIEDPVILNQVIEETSYPGDIDDLRKSVVIDVQEDSQIFGIEVTDTNPRRATLLANGIAKTFQENVGEILSVENVAILSPAVQNNDPISPSLFLNSIIGGITGLLFGAVIGVLQVVTDRKIRDEETVLALLQWNHIGSLTEMTKADRELDQEPLHPQQTPLAKEHKLTPTPYSRKETEHVS